MVFPLAGSRRDQDCDDRETGSERTERLRIRLTLLGLSLHYTDGREVMDLFRHRYMLANYVAISLKLMLMFYVSGFSVAPIGKLFPSLVVSVAGAILCYWTYLKLAVSWAEWRLARRGGADGPMATIRLEPGLVLTALAMMATFDLAQRQLRVRHDWTWQETVFLFFFGLAYIFFIGRFMMVRVAPRVLRRMRSDRALSAREAGAWGAAAGGDDPHAPPAEGEDRLAVAAEEPPVASGGRGLPAALLSGVLRLEARGNYVAVVTRTATRLVPGPFAAVMAQMPQDGGQRVHRSHWVARHAVLSHRRIGRDLQLQMLDGAVVPVASSRACAVQAWLAQGDGASPDMWQPAGKAARE